MLNFRSKIKTPTELQNLILNNQIQREIVFTNGFFDILHRGHVTYLQQAKNLGKTLIVALNSDASVKKLNKGKNRPINPLDDRLDVIASLQSVDFVTYFEQDTPLELILQFQPDILVKGGDWKIENIVGAESVTNNCGKVFSIPFEFDTSTSKIIQKILQE